MPLIHLVLLSAWFYGLRWGGANAAAWYPPGTPTELFSTTGSTRLVNLNPVMPFLAETCY